MLVKKDSLTIATKNKDMKPHHVRYAAFGTTVQRFGCFTQHPQLDRHGLFTRRPTACDPCRYLPVVSHNICKRRNHPGKDVWRFKQELEEWSSNLGYRNTAILDARKWQVTLLGPAWYDAPHIPKADPIVCQNIGFGRTPRFKAPSKAIDNPPAGTYYHEFPYKAPHGPHSKRPSFEHREPCRFKNISSVLSLAPNRYYIKDPDSIAEKPNKIVSLKGPYNLTSGKRIMVQKQTCSASTWPVSLPGSFETYKKSHLGVINKSGFDNRYRGRNALTDIALCIKKASDPGPAEQNIEKPRLFKQCRYGFNSSNDKPVGYIRATVWPAVGRYSLRQVKGHDIPGMGHTHVFKSKVQRSIGSILPKPMNSF